MPVAAEDMEGRAVTEKLKWCPFCRKVDYVEYEHWARWHYISCQNEDCYVQPVVVGDTKREVYARWNRRGNRRKADD